MILQLILYKGIQELPIFLTNYSPLTTLLLSVLKLLSTLGGPECRLGLAGEAGYERRFFAVPREALSFSGVPFFSAAKGLCNLDFALADSVGTM